MNHVNAKTNMIKQQLRTGDVLSDRILNLYQHIPRHEFVPNHLAPFAYSDMQIPLAHQQRMLTPLEEGILLQSLDLKGHETLLEVGTGTGFFTALLSQLCKKVISIDYYAEFTTHAAQKLQQYGCHNVELITGDACQGWIEKAPYDVIVFTGALESLSETQTLQLLPEGKLFAIEGQAPIMQANLYQLHHDKTWKKSMLFETEIPLLINKSRTREFVF